MDWPRTAVEIAMDGGFFPSKAARDTQEELEKLQATMDQWGDELRERMRILLEEIMRELGE